MNETQKHPTNPAGVWFSIPGKSHLAQYRYNPATQELDVQFKGNPTCYRYSPVSLELINGFKASGNEGSELTKGEYLARYVKANLDIQYRKLTEEEAK